MLYIVVAGRNAFDEKRILFLLCFKYVQVPNKSDISITSYGVSIRLMFSSSSQSNQAGNSLAILARVVQRVLFSACCFAPPHRSSDGTEMGRLSRSRSLGEESTVCFYFQLLGSSFFCGYIFDNQESLESLNIDLYLEAMTIIQLNILLKDIPMRY